MVTNGADSSIIGFFHAGVTVWDLDRSLAFYRDLLGLEVVVERHFTEPYILEVVGVQASGLRIAILKIPNTDVLIELLEYRDVERHAGDSRPCDPGTGHFCLYVTGIDEFHSRLKAAGVKSRSSVPVLITAGPNQGCRVIYVSDPDGYHVEIFERLKPFNPAP